MAIVGLIAITLGWVAQFLSMKKKDQKLNPLFLMMYSLGVLFIIVDGFTTKAMPLAVANIASLLASFSVYLKVQKIV